MCDSRAAPVSRPPLSEFTPLLGHAAALETDDDFFQFAGEVGLMDIDVPDASLATGAFSASPTPAGKASAPSHRQSTTKVSSEARLQRVREKNRKAQARLRQRQKELCAQAQQKVEATQEQVIRARQRREGLNEQRNDISQRYSSAAKALRHVATAAHASFLPEPSSTATYQPDPCPQRFQSRSSPARLGHQVNTADQPARTGQAVTLANTAAKQRAIASWVPPPISSFHICQPLFPHQLPGASTENSRLQSPRSLLDITLHATPACSYRSSCLDVFHDYKAATAAQLGVGMKDVCWFVQTPYEVSSHRPLSLSTTLSSPECVCSFILIFLASNLSNYLYLVLLDSLDVAHSFDEVSAPMGPTTVEDAPGHSSRPNRAKSPRFDGPSGHTITPPSAACINDPLRGSNGPWAREAARTGSAGCDLESKRPRHVRCGVNDVCEEGAAVHAVLRRIMARFIGRLPTHVLQESCDMLLSQAGQVLSGFQSAPVPQQCCPQEQATSDVLAGTGKGGDHGGVAREEPAVDASAFARYHEGVTAAAMSLLTTVCSMVRAMREELDDSWPIAAAFPRAAVPEPRAALERWVLTGAIAFGFGEALIFQDAPRVSRSLCANAAISMMTSVIDVDNMHVRLYRKLKLTAEQRHSMALMWHSWVRHRRALTTSMDAAARDLRSLPDSVPLPLDTLSHISNLASGRTSRPVSCILPGGAAGSCSCTCGCGCAAAAAAAAAAQPQLLGAAPAVTAAAAEALAALQAVHDTDAEEVNHTASIALQPGLNLSPAQHIRFVGAHLTANTAPADHLALCQLAATQAHRIELCRKTSF